MSRGLANHRLYLAKLLIGAWERDRQAEVVPARTLDQAYAPAVRDHLIAAYGYFLNYVLDPVGATTSAAPPRCCADLPPQVAGKARPGEIREFEQLEQEGWLAQLLAPLPASAGPVARRQRPDALAVSGSGESAWPAPDDAATWCRRLQSIFERMDNSLDEC